MEKVKLRFAVEFDCPECGKMGFASYIPYDSSEEPLDINRVLPRHLPNCKKIPPYTVLCKHCNEISNTKENDELLSLGLDNLVDLRLAWEFDCPECKKLSFSSFVPYRPSLEHETEGAKISVSEFKTPNEVWCQHCGNELETTGRF